MGCYRVLEMQNGALGAVSAGSTMPFGTITRRIADTNGCYKPFEVMTSGADTVALTEKGYYNVIYSASVVAAGAGTLTLSLVANGTTLYTVSATVAQGDTVNLTLPKQVRAFANCASCPTNIPLALQIQLGGVGITGGTANIRVERMVG